MDISPEGALFVTGSEDGILRLGESASGRVTVHVSPNLWWLHVKNPAVKVDNLTIVTISGY